MSKNNYIKKLKGYVDWVFVETLKINLNSPETRIASSLSPIEIFVSLFYGGVLKYFPSNPLNTQRDRLIISKGHGSICLYPILADLGFIKKSELSKICKKGGILGGIPDPIIPGYETINGSLGHGLGVGTGIALALKRKKKNNSVFIICGDGELNEGSCWEAIMFAGHHKLDNINLIIDNNSISMLGYSKDIINLNVIADKFKCFGWHTSEVDGHSVDNVNHTLKKLKSTFNKKPKVIIANTIKGRGINDLSNKPLSHVLNPNRSNIEKIIKNYEEN